MEPTNSVSSRKRFVNTLKTLKNAMAIPEEIRALGSSWIPWVYKTGPDGKRKKLPLLGRGIYAKVSHKESHNLFEDAVWGMILFEGDGINFRLDNNYTAIDLDDVGKEITPLVQSILNYFASYAEISPSGNGIHIIVRGVMPKEFKHVVEAHGQKIEMYSANHYMSFTGDVIPGFETLSDDGQLKLDSFGDFLGATQGVDIFRPAPVVKDIAQYEISLSDKEVLAKALKNKRFSDLFNGIDMTKSDRSSLDLALCLNLCFWFNGNVERIDRVFRQSKLYREEKWDRHAHSDGRSYGRMTIDKAIEYWDGQHYKVFTPKPRDTPPTYSSMADTIFEHGIAVLDAAAGNGPAKASYKRVWLKLCDLLRNSMVADRDGQKHIILTSMFEFCKDIGGNPADVALRLRYLHSLGFIGAVENFDKSDKTSPLIVLIPNDPRDMGVLKYTIAEASFLLLTGIRKTAPVSKSIKPVTKKVYSCSLQAARFTAWYIKKYPNLTADELSVKTGVSIRTIKEHIKVLMLWSVIESNNGRYTSIADVEAIIKADREILSKLKVRTIEYYRRAKLWAYNFAVNAPSAKMRGRNMERYNRWTKKLVGLNAV